MSDAIPSAIRHASLLRYADDCAREAIETTDTQRMAELSQEAMMARARALLLEVEA